MVPVLCNAPSIPSPGLGIAVRVSIFPQTPTEAGDFAHQESLNWPFRPPVTAQLLEPLRKVSEFQKGDDMAGIVRTSFKTLQSL